MSTRSPALILILPALLVVSPALAQKQSLEVVRKVVLDPGHGGDNKGALAYTGAYEKDIVLQIALKARKEIQARTDAEVLLTREDDRSVGLKDRVAMANEAGADLLISIHCNSSFSLTPQGVETYVLSEQALKEETGKLSRQVVQPRGLYASAADSAAAAVVKEMLQYSAFRDAHTLASVLQNAVVRRTKAMDRGVKELPIVVLRGAEMPGIVVEVGFASHPVEAEQLTEDWYQERIAQAIADAVIRYDELAAQSRSGVRTPVSQSR
ncbi:MAG: N-acetylmuramoyl-L-alanine amidase [Deltaproteobacteria bacterium]|nr:N-acetylmuramoyl-L-alanine amidase [Deltaproteobacteria bacterium]